MRGAVLFIVAVLTLAQAHAADVLPGTQLAPDPDLDRPNRTYQACLQLARKQPDKALELAGKWIALGGTEAAHHCQALALIGLKDYGEGATRLEELVQHSIQPALVRANMLAQAAQAWLLQDEPSRAYADQTAALKLVPCLSRSAYRSSSVPYFLSRAVAVFGPTLSHPLMLSLLSPTSASQSTI